MIDFGSFSFAAAPRTGSTWFLNACTVAGLGQGFKAQAHEPPPPNHGGIIVSLFRHPYDWLVSYYQALKGGAVGVPCVDRFCETARESKSIVEFIAKYVQMMPGAVSEMFAEYQCSTVIRLEDLPWAAVEFLQSVGVKRKLLESIRDASPLNSYNGYPHRRVPRLVKRVYEVDAEFCDRYEYSPWGVA